LEGEQLPSIEGSWGSGDLAIAVLLPNLSKNDENPNGCKCFKNNHYVF